MQSIKKFDDLISESDERMPNYLRGINIEQYYDDMGDMGDKIFTLLSDLCAKWGLAPENGDIEMLDFLDNLKASIEDSSDSIEIVKYEE